MDEHIENLEGKLLSYRSRPDEDTVEVEDQEGVIYQLNINAIVENWFELREQIVVVECMQCKATWKPSLMTKANDKLYCPDCARFL
jgi:hypothetical protein